MPSREEYIRRIAHQRGTSVLAIADSENYVIFVLETGHKYKVTDEELEAWIATLTPEPVPPSPFEGIPPAGEGKPKPKRKDSA